MPNVDHVFLSQSFFILTKNYKGPNYTDIAIWGLRIYDSLVFKTLIILN